MKRLIRNLAAIPQSIAAIALVLATGTSAFAQFTTQSSLFADPKAQGVGDILTLVIVEKTSGSNTAATAANRSDTYEQRASLGTGAFDFLPDFGWDAEFESDHQGAGQATRQGNLNARISVTVDSVYANGNMRIGGTREVQINGETEILTVAGLVRPADIGPGNVIFSTHVADARISYRGDGQVDRVQRGNWISRVIGWIF
ncbi:MAG: flagellar basal body L-ring protein FlgH [Gemmatimonadetes bacterium]|nr:flagellar basal body L-ring protein FlgH [Gemmatimonadota bacterium]